MHIMCINCSALLSAESAKGAELKAQCGESTPLDDLHGAAMRHCI